MTTPEALGAALQRMRKLKKLNQTEAGRPFNLSQRTVSMLEHGLPGIRLDTLFRMLAALELELVICDKPRIDKLGENGW